MRSARSLLPIVAGLVVGGGAFGVLAVLDDESPPRAVVDAASTTNDDRGRAIFARMGCGSCHRLAAAGSSGAIGPNLDTRLAGYTASALIERIVRRDPDGGFSAMPDDFGERMTDAELDALVRFLLATRDRAAKR